MTDIVTRLRDRATAFKAQDNLSLEAADEIERLRSRSMTLTDVQRHVLEVAIDAFDPEFGELVVCSEKTEAAEAIHGILVRVRECL